MHFCTKNSPHLINELISDLLLKWRQLSCDVTCLGLTGHMNEPNFVFLPFSSRCSGFLPHDPMAGAGGMPPPDGGMGGPAPLGPKRGFSMGSAEDRAGEERTRIGESNFTWWGEI